MKKNSLKLHNKIDSLILEKLPVFASPRPLRTPKI